MLEEPLERERELAQIRDVLDDAIGGRGQLLLVEGPAGIGKSRLLAEAEQTGLELGLRVLRARAGELEQAHPFGLVLSLLEAALVRAPRGELEVLLRGRAALAAPLLSGSSSASTGATTSDRFALVHGLYWSVVNLSEQGPVALIVDDLHWADELSLEFLIYLANRVESLPVALIGAIRTGDPGAVSDHLAMLATTGASRVLRPAALSPAAVSGLIRRGGVGAVASDAFAEESWRVTGGNPFLVHELAAAIRADPAAWTSADLSALQSFAPASVSRSVLVRLGRLGSDAVALARACAVLGTETPMTLAAMVAQLEPAAAGAATERLLAAQILESSDPLQFVHPMVRSAVYAECPPDVTGRLHVTAARVLWQVGTSADTIAQHLLAGTPTSEPWARQALHDAGRIAAQKGSPQEGVRALRRALELDPLSDANGPLLIDLGLVEAAAGEMTSLERFNRALTLLEEPHEQARALFELGRTLYRYGRAEEAAATFAAGIDRFAETDPAVALRFEGARMCCANIVMSIHDTSMARLTELVNAIPDDRRPTTAERTLLAVHACSTALTVPRPDETAGLARRALKDGVLLREETSESMAITLAIIALICSGHAGEAKGHADALLKDARERGATLAFAEASMVRAMAALAGGRLTDAMADAETAIEGLDRGWHALVPVPHAILAYCLIVRSDPDGARVVLDVVQPLLPDGGHTAWYHWARGHHHAALDRPGPALAEFLAARDKLAAYGCINPAAVPWGVPAALAAHAADENEHARELIDEQLALSESFGLPALAGAALRAQAIIAGPTREALEHAITILEPTDMPHELARALADLGGLLRRTGHRVEARVPLRHAQELASRAGATALQQHIHQELLATGSRPRRLMTRGLESLTPSERRIADLVATGATNRSVAETLFITPGTVQWHLKQIYQKLDVTSRQQLANLLSGDAIHVAVDAEPASRR